MLVYLRPPNCMSEEQIYSYKVLGYLKTLYKGGFPNGGTC